MEEQKVSVIMSCYNAEKTLARAIESVMNNTYKNIELMLIDDCSTDNSLNIAKEYQSKDDRIIIITHSENQGAGVSRKDGIEKCSGDYICFCDSDDEILSNHIENLVNAAIEHNADIVTSGYLVKDGETDEFMENRKTDELVILEGNNKYAVLKADILRFLNPSLVKKHLWDKVTYSSRRYIEDSPTLIKLLWYANKRVVLPQSTYIYYQNKGSLTHIENPFRKILYETLCVTETYNFFTKEVKNPQFVPTRGVVMKLAIYLEAEPSEEDKKVYKNEINEVKSFIKEYYEEKFE